MYYLAALVISINGIIGVVSTNLLQPLLYKKNNADEYIGIVLIILALSALISIISFLYFDQILHYLSKFENNLEEDNAQIAIYFSIAIFLSVVNEMLIAIFKGKSNFRLPNIGLILGTISNILILTVFNKYISESFILLSISINNFICTVYLLYYFPKKNFKINIYNINVQKKYLAIGLSAIVFQILSVVSNMFPYYLASSMDAGTVGSFSIAKKLFDVVPSALILPIVSAYAPSLACALDLNEKTHISKNYQHVLNILILLLIPLLISICVDSKTILHILFGDLVSENLLINSMVIILFFGLIAASTNAIITRLMILNINLNNTLISGALSLVPAILLPNITYIAITFFGGIGLAIGMTVYLILIHQTMGMYLAKKLLLINGYKILIYSLISSFKLYLLPTILYLIILITISQDFIQSVAILILYISICYLISYKKILDENNKIHSN